MIPPTLIRSRQSQHSNFLEMPNRIAITFINLSRPLEALNFCLSSLDVSSEACITHPSYDRRAALKGLSPGPTSTTGVNSPDLTRYNKSDFDPSLPPPTRFQTRGPSYILYTFALAGYKVYGPSNFSTHCLRRAYHSNPCLYELLARKDPPVEPRGLDLAFQYLHFERLWKTKEMLEWLSVSREEMEKRICDGVECGKVEETVGAWEMCSGCEKRWYCSTECREGDWLTGGHKGLCQDEQSFRKSLNYL